MLEAASFSSASSRFIISSRNALLALRLRVVRRAGGAGDNGAAAAKPSDCSLASISRARPAASFVPATAVEVRSRGRGAGGRSPGRARRARRGCSPFLSLSSKLSRTALSSSLALLFSAALERAALPSSAACLLFSTASFSSATVRLSLWHL
jgi:hypothetical protein